jgi:hypothetical protein
MLERVFNAVAEKLENLEMMNLNLQILSKVIEILLILKLEYLRLNIKVIKIVN